MYIYQEEQGAILCRQEEAPPLPTPGKDDAVAMSLTVSHKRDFVSFQSG